MEGDFYSDSFSLLCFQYPCEYGEECSGYHPEIDNECLYKDAEIFDNTSVDARIVDEEGFTIRKRRRTLDPKDNTIIRHRTYECSYASAHEPQKAVLEEDRRDQESHMTGCSWHIIFAFPKSADKIQVNSIISEHNHEMNPLIAEIAPKFRKLTDEMLEKIKFWTIHGRMGIATQYNLLVASFPQKVINKKDLSNMIQRFKKQVKPDKNDAFLYSDADPALILSIRNNYPETWHLHCIFHIDLNLRKKLKGKLRDQFESFCSKFLVMHNSLCPNKFEAQWNTLINEYPDSKNYLIRTLYPCKSSWASYVINRNFTVRIQSTQRAEVCNKIIKDKLTRTSRLADVVEEIQKVFNNQSKKAILSEYKNEIPTRGMPSISDEYFPGLDTILKEYLTSQILQKQHDQIAQSLCYDVFLINDWQSLLEMTDDSYQQNIAREDDYDQPQSLFSSLLEKIPSDSVKEVWKAIRYSVQNSEPQPIILFNDGSHLCTCLLLINKGIPQGPKQKYGFGMGYAKKALDLAIQADRVEEFVSHLKDFIEDAKNDLFSTQDNASSLSIRDPLHVPHKGRQPNRYKSGGEPLRKA
ncbi:4876_t:CDS:2 [Cetraspora pellucida]|uniref:4876_t:CDS:1 n=1 Tax=Cetraspora pellucida TaxID=1433469 RepID=A0A9N9JDA1_9GLOM|nr:4876_t:CDS:2 [Cetraspora pellucida]